MSEHNVCSNSVFNGSKSEQVTLKNENSNAVTVSVCDTNDWPFSSPASPITVPAKVGSTPGTVAVTLLGTDGTYHYCTSGCPAQLKADVNPKTVIIS